MVSDRERWDAKHAAAMAVLPLPPDAALVEVLEGCVPGGRALDLASGTGRHALELARRGYRVEAWDVSPVGLHILERKADLHHLEVATRAHDLVADGLPLDAPAFDLVVMVDFLDRPLYCELHRLIVPGGELVLTTFTDDWPGERPSRRFRLRAGELAAGLPGLEVLRAEERGGRALLHAGVPSSPARSSSPPPTSPT